MIARAGSGWQYALADLSLILFMITASVLAQADGRIAPEALSSQAEPLALWRADPAMPPLQEWLAAQPGDPRQQLTIIARYNAGEQAIALDAARVLAASAAEAGANARIIIEPGAQDVAATLAYDMSEEVLARGLPEQAAEPFPRSRP